MIPDAVIAEHAMLAYDKPTIEVGNAAARVDVIEDFSLVSVAGTNGLIDGVDNLLAFPWKPHALNEWVHFGMWRYTNRILDEVIDQLLTNNKDVYLTGHSLGGSTANNIAAVCEKIGINVANLTTFGAPPSGYGGFNKLISHIPGKRYAREGDQVTTWPTLVGLSHARNATLLPGDPGPVDHLMQGYLDLMTLAE